MYCKYRYFTRMSECYKNVNSINIIILFWATAGQFSCWQGCVQWCHMPLHEWGTLNTMVLRVCQYLTIKKWPTCGYLCRAEPHSIVLSTFRFFHSSALVGYLCIWPSSHIILSRALAENRSLFCILLYVTQWWLGAYFKLMAHLVQIKIQLCLSVHMFYWIKLH